MKALSTTILIVVTAVVILVAALVVLTIFGGGVGNVAQMTQLRNTCLTQCSIACKAGSTFPPPTWTATGCDKVTPSISASDCGCGATTGGTLGTASGCCKYPNGNCLSNLAFTGGETKCKSDGGTWSATCPSDCK